jgi:hypothetical protein
MWVTAQPGQWCPKEGAFSGRITDNKPELVPVNRYYNRLLADGSLRMLTDAQAQAIITQSSESDTAKKTAKGSKQ